jgi:hypothetical protein
MIPVGYQAKLSCTKPEALQLPDVVDVYSVSNCVNEDFAAHTNDWKHNGYWLFDSPEIIRAIAREHSINLEGAKLFYYEAHEMEFNEKKSSWSTFSPKPSIVTGVVVPTAKRLEGFDLVTFFARNAPECSPLSCNRLAAVIPTNSNCLIGSFEEAKAALDSGKFDHAEPGPYRIFAVYSVEWPQSG